MTELADVLTVGEAATALGVTRDAIRGAIHRGVLTAIHLDGRTRVIPREQVEHYRQAHQGRVGRPPKSKTQPARPAD